MNIKKFLLLQARSLYNPAMRALRKASSAKAELPALAEIQERAKIDTDINEHLVPLFTEAASMRPALIVELGVRGGESTFVLERVAQLFGSALVSVDIEDCQRVSAYKKWIFMREDDIALAKRFKNVAEEKGLPNTIDVLFVDTSHVYDHTAQEIRHWFPFLAPHAKVIFHDTHMKDVYFKKDGTMRFGWDNQRGVIRAIEDYFGARWDESKDFIDYRNGWLIKHAAHSNGFTVLERLQA